VNYRRPWENFDHCLTEMVSVAIAFSVVSENQNLVDPVHDDKSKGRHQVEAGHPA